MDSTFTLDRPVYTPREVGYLYTKHVRPVSYPTVLEWIEVWRTSGGKEGMQASKTPRGRYLIAATEVERILLQAGATKSQEAADASATV